LRTKKHPKGRAPGFVEGFWSLARGGEKNAGKELLPKKKRDPGRTVGKGSRRTGTGRDDSEEKMERGQKQSDERGPIS